MDMSGDVRVLKTKMIDILKDLESKGLYLSHDETEHKARETLEGLIGETSLEPELASVLPLVLGAPKSLEQIIEQQVLASDQVSKSATAALNVFQGMVDQTSLLLGQLSDLQDPSRQNFFSKAKNFLKSRTIFSVQSQINFLNDEMMRNIQDAEKGLMLEGDLCQISQSLPDCVQTARAILEHSISSCSNAIQETDKQVDEASFRLNQARQNQEDAKIIEERQKEHDRLIEEQTKLHRDHTIQTQLIQQFNQSGSVAYELSQKAFEKHKEKSLAFAKTRDFMLSHATPIQDLAHLPSEELTKASPSLIQSLSDVLARVREKITLGFNGSGALDAKNDTVDVAPLSLSRVSENITTQRAQKDILEVGPKSSDPRKSAKV